jgi:hypothetical protein
MNLRKPTSPASQERSRGEVARLPMKLARTDATTLVEGLGPVLRK